MSFLAWMLIFLMALPAFGQGNEAPSEEISAAADSKIFASAARYFAEGRYQATVEELTSLDQSSLTKSQQGLIAYWKGIAQNRLQDFPKAIENFQKALDLGYSPQDIHYELGQALFASERYKEARLQFRNSMKKAFKRGVSLYYIAYLSNELGDHKKAVTFYKAIDKLGDEGKEVRQAAQVQIGDIYLQQVERTRDSFRSVEKYVIPQYRYALSLDRESALAPTIKEKIVDIQRKYDLILFRLRNGRPALDPPYLLRASTEVGMDTNVTFAPTETTVSTADQASLYARADFLGRYTYYYQNYFSVSPELRANRTYYFKRIPEIYRNDNILIAPAVRLAYEHTLWEKPAAHLFDYEYADARRDVDAKKELVFSSRSHTLMAGERFNYFKMGESIVRLKYRIFQSFDDNSDSDTTSLVFEQIAGFSNVTMLFYLSYDRTRVNNPEFSNDSLSLRADAILPRIGQLFTPTIGLGLTTVDPINDRENRGRELLINPNLRLTRMFGKRWRANLKYDYQNYKSEDETLFAYKKSLYALELEYLF